MLWNPATKGIRTVPTLRYYDEPPRVHSSWVCLQLGWDQRINDYKVVVFANRWKETNKYYDGHYVGLEDEHVVVYSLNNDAWRHFEDDVPFYDVDSKNYKYWSGVFNSFQLGHKTGKLLSFDPSDEVFKEIRGPDFLLGPHNKNAQLAMHNEHITSFHSDFFMHERCFDIWVLVEGFWNKMLTIGPLLGVRKQLGFWKHSEVFFEASGVLLDTSTFRLVLYDPQPNNLKIFEFVVTTFKFLCTRA